MSRLCVGEDFDWVNYAVYPDIIIDFIGWLFQANLMTQDAILMQQLLSINAGIEEVKQQWSYERDFSDSESYSDDVSLLGSSATLKPCGSDVRSASSLTSVDTLVDAMSTKSSFSSKLSDSESAYSSPDSTLTSSLSFGSHPDSGLGDSYFETSSQFANDDDDLARNFRNNDTGSSKKRFSLVINTDVAQRACAVLPNAHQRPHSMCEIRNAYHSDDEDHADDITILPTGTLIKVTHYRQGSYDSSATPTVHFDDPEAGEIFV